MKFKNRKTENKSMKGMAKALTKNGRYITGIVLLILVLLILSGLNMNIINAILIMVMAYLMLILFKVIK